MYVQLMKKAEENSWSNIPYLVENNLLPERTHQITLNHKWLSNVEKSYKSYLPSANVEVCSYFNVWKDGFLEINILKTTLIWSHFLGGHLFERLTWSCNYYQDQKHPQFNTTLDFSRQICHMLQEASQAVWSTLSRNLRKTCLIIKPKKVCMGFDFEILCLVQVL